VTKERGGERAGECHQQQLEGRSRSPQLLSMAGTSGGKVRLGCALSLGSTVRGESWKAGC
jgi:hypothetical protein